MSESDVDQLGSREQPRRKSGYAVAITAIVVAGVLVLACILAVAGVAIVLIYNLPW